MCVAITTRFRSVLVTNSGSWSRSRNPCRKNTHFGDKLYLARALLQKADLVILDESLASLDPENLRGALRCVLARAPTVLIIAHP